MPTYDPRRRRERRARRPQCGVRAGLATVLLLLAAGCDFPTSLPKWNTQWLVPVRNTEFTVAQLLPTAVITTADNSAFVVSVAPITISRSLAALCAACVPVNGLVVAKPAFTATVSDTLRLPSDVAAATLAGGTVAVSIANGLDFDPIRPSATQRGTITLTLTSGSATIGTLTLNGATDVLPANSSLTRSVTLASGVPVSGKIAAVLAVSSPAGDPVRIDASETFSITVTPQTIRVSDATVAVSGKSVAIQPVELNVSDIDQSLIDRVQAGALVLGIVNPFGVTGTLNLTIVGPGVTIRKPVQLGTGATTQRVPFTTDEIKSILGRSGVTFTATGPVSSPQPVKVSPAQAAQVTAQLELTLGSQGS